MPHQLKYYFLLLFFFFNSFIYSQSPLKFYEVNYQNLDYSSIGFRGGFGFIVPHRASMTHLITGHVYSGELFIEHCSKTKNWQKLYNYATCGFNFYFSYLANPDVLGNALALDYFSNLHLIKRKRFLFDLRLASGLGFLSKNFNPDYNNQNIAIGSKFNISIGASFDIKFQISKDWQLGTGISLKHFSNGSFVTPNLGINIPVLMVTLKKQFAADNREYAKADSSEVLKIKNRHKKHLDILGAIGYGAREISPPGGKKYSILALEGTAHYRFTPKVSLLAGIDIIHNVALYQSVKNDSTFNGTQIDITQFAAGIGYAQVFDNFELFLLNSFYIYSVSKKDGPVYQRIGGRYFINEKLHAHFALKTHFAKADYFEIGFGYNFNWIIISPPNEIW